MDAFWIINVFQGISRYFRYYYLTYDSKSVWDRINLKFIYKKKISDYINIYN